MNDETKELTKGTKVKAVTARYGVIVGTITEKSDMCIMGHHWYGIKSNQVGNYRLVWVREDLIDVIPQLPGLKGV